MSKRFASPCADVEERLRFEGLVAELLVGFVNIPPDKVDGAIVDAQRRICEALGLDRSTLSKHLADSREIELTHSWARPEFTPNPLIPAGRIFPWMFQQLLSGRTVQFASVEDLPAEASVDKETLRRMGPKSNVSFPLVAGGKMLGALSFGALRAERQWSGDLVDRLRLIAELFANALSRKAADEALRHALDEVRQLKDRLQQENLYLQQENRLYTGSEFVGESAAILEVQSLVRRVAPTPSAVLITGETGTGKELVAQAIHDRSERRARTMVKVNCAALPAALIEGELFGRDKGAYTGAMNQQKGRFEIADGSTFFLDEIGDLPLELQSKLLRVLQEGQFERLGSTRTQKVDVRIIAATNRDLPAMIKAGTFRSDLYYRLNVFPIHIPPLRERPDDILPLAWFFVREFSERMGKKIDSIPKKTVAALMSAPWPGNVREMRNVIEHAIIMSDGATLRVAPLGGANPEAHATPVTLRETEKQAISQALRQTNGRICGKNGAAELLDLKPTTLHSKMKKLGLSRFKETTI